jgi:hypothetical protein
VIVPIELPGDSVPLIVVEGSVPVPPTSAPAPTVRLLDDAIEPLTINAPALTLVAPV